MANNSDNKSSADEAGRLAELANRAATGDDAAAIELADMVRAGRLITATQTQSEDAKPWSYLKTEPKTNAPISDNPSGMWCRACRESGVNHCAHPEWCGGMELMRPATQTQSEGWTGRKCPDCKGSGFSFDDRGEERKCPSCGGTGDEYGPLAATPPAPSRDAVEALRSALEAYDVTNKRAINGQTSLYSLAGAADRVVAAARAALASADARQGDGAAMREALERLLSLYPREGETSFECFERTAALFRAETGYVAPGKDCTSNTRVERLDAWDKWMDANIARARAALTPSAGGK